MGTLNYALAYALALVGWSYREAARYLNAYVRHQGHQGIAIDHTRVGRWIRHGEIPRAPIPELLAGLLSKHLGEPVTPEDLALVPARNLRVTVNDQLFGDLLRHAARTGLSPEQCAAQLLRAALTAAGPRQENPTKDGP